MAVVAITVPRYVSAQTPPPYSMLDPTPYNPAVDPNSDMFIRSWKESMPRQAHGSLVERDILTRGDSLHPTSKGAVLSYVNRFVHASLEAGASTTPSTLKDEQEIYYILSGTGTMTAGKKIVDLYRGIAVLVPANLEFRMKNTGDVPLTMYLVAEPCPAGFRYNTELLVVDENSTPVSSSNAHWVGIVKPLLSTKDGLGTLESILTCQFDPMTFFQPHSHDKGTEEVWCTINGDVYVLLGKQIRFQPPGTAYMIPPDSKSPHANFNVSDRMINMFYFARYRDHEVRK